jgi:hypothetical protein
VKRFDVRGEDDTVYLTLWTLASLFGYRLTVHKMHRPDADTCCHDHPWGFVSLVLWGGYVEEVEREHPGIREGNWRGDYMVRERRWNRPGTLLLRPATWCHRIASLPRGTCWTLLIRAPERREWGFWTRFGWMHWRAFVNATGRAAWCDEAPAGQEVRDATD